MSKELDKKISSSEMIKSLAKRNQIKESEGEDTLSGKIMDQGRKQDKVVAEAEKICQLIKNNSDEMLCVLYCYGKVSVWDRKVAYKMNKLFTEKYISFLNKFKEIEDINETVAVRAYVTSRMDFATVIFRNSKKKLAASLALPFFMAFKDRIKMFKGVYEDLETIISVKQNDLKIDLGNLTYRNPPSLFQLLTLINPKIEELDNSELEQVKITVKKAAVLLGVEEKLPSNLKDAVVMINKGIRDTYTSVTQTGGSRPDYSMEVDWKKVENF